MGTSRESSLKRFQMCFVWVRLKPCFWFQVKFTQFGGVMKLVNMLHLKCNDRKVLGVQVPSPLIYLVQAGFLNRLSAVFLRVFLRV